MSNRHGRIMQSEASAGSQSEASAGSFSGRAAVLFGIQIFGAVIGIVNGILLARLLGPAGKGAYYILILVPSTTMVMLQLGLPQAFMFFAARGRTAAMLPKAFVLTATFSLAGFLVVVVFLPLLRGAIFHDLGLEQILFAFLALPLALSATLTTGIVMGRQAVRWYAIVNIASPIATTVLLILILGGLGPSVNGAIAVYLLGASIQAVGFAIGARRLTAAMAGADSVSFRELFRYGLPYYPGSLTQFFSYRVDVYLIAFLIATPAEPLGYYSMAVGLAEMVFFFPNAVATVFFPHVAGSAREDSDRQVARVSRVTFLVTGAAALALVPASIVMIWVLLPAFGPSIPPLLVLLPGVAALSVTKVVAGYVSGIGRPGLTSNVNIAAFVLNVAANLILIPRFGIVGASAASLVSYTASSIALTAIAARLTGVPMLDFWAPRLSDIRFVLSTSLGLLRRARDAARTTPRAITP
jgi:O-antigen/teichoic acid export membrane protein